MNGPRLGTLSNNRWSGGTVKASSFGPKGNLEIISLRTKPECIFLLLKHFFLLVRMLLRVPTYTVGTCSSGNSSWAKATSMQVFPVLPSPTTVIFVQPGAAAADAEPSLPFIIFTINYHNASRKAITGSAGQRRHNRASTTRFMFFFFFFVYLFLHWRLFAEWAPDTLHQGVTSSLHVHDVRHRCSSTTCDGW